MTNSRATGTTMVQLDKHTATGTETTYTFTPTAGIDLTNYVELHITFSGETTATFILQWKLNGVATGYYSYGYTADVSSIVTVAPASNASEGVLADATVNSATTALVGRLILTIQPTDASYNIAGTSNFSSNSSAHTQLLNHTNSGNITSITSVEIKVSTSSWKSGTVITVWGLRY